MPFETSGREGDCWPNPGAQSWRLPGLLHPRLTCSEDSPGAALNSSPSAGAGTSMTRSIRSEQGRRLTTVAADLFGVQRQRPRGSPKKSARAGFIAATSWKRAGKVARRAAREIVTSPVSERLAGSAF